MKVLGLDTIFLSSCAAVVEDENRVLSNVVLKYKKLSGDRIFDLYPFHLKQVNLAIKRTLKLARLKIQDISLIAVSNSGSLLSTIMVGVATANALSRMYNIPVFGVDHQEAHFFSNWLERNSSEFKFPIIVLSSSGATSGIILIKNQLDFKKITQVWVGKEEVKNRPAFLGIGTVYSLLSEQLGLGRGAGVGYLVSKFAKGGNPARFNFKIPQNRSVGDLDFTWLKREVVRIIFKEDRKTKKLGSYSKKFISDICASLEKSISETLINDLLILAKKYKAKEIHLAGGISANPTLRRSLKEKTKKFKIIARYPVKKEYCTDNAAMIASRGYYLYTKNPKKYLKQRAIKVISDLKLEKIAASQFLKAN